jgi:hypothetical protein
MQHVKHMMLSEVRRPTMHRHDAPCPLLSPLMSVPLICIVSRLSSMCLRFAGSPPTPRPDHLLSRSLQEEPPILRNAVVDYAIVAYDDGKVRRYKEPTLGKLTLEGCASGTPGSFAVLFEGTRVEHRVHGPGAVSGFGYFTRDGKSAEMAECSRAEEPLENDTGISEQKPCARALSTTKCRQSACRISRQGIRRNSVQLPKELTKRVLRRTGVFRSPTSAHTVAMLLYLNEDT